MDASALTMVALASLPSARPGAPGRRSLRIRVLHDGRIEIVDPDPTILPLMQTLDPSYRVRTAPLPNFVSPRLLATRATAAGAPLDDLQALSLARLWEIHKQALATRAPCAPGETSLLDLKVELAHRLLRSCELCALRCRVDRTRGKRGRCGLGPEAFVYEAYLHIAEEPPINPASNISLRGCGMRCRYCQQFEALKPGGAHEDALTPEWWDKMDFTGARSLVFVGGNPTESLPAVLAFLRATPESFGLPIGWNSSGFDTPEAIAVLDAVCDVYIPDFKYGNEECAARLSLAPGYVANARAALQAMCSQHVPVFVRLLVLPGHVECCHLPSIELLAPLRTKVRLNVMAQYAPDSLIRTADGPLARRPVPAEVERVRQAASDAGLSLI